MLTDIAELDANPCPILPSCQQVFGQAATCSPFRHNNYATMPLRSGQERPQPRPGTDPKEFPVATALDSFVEDLHELDPDALNCKQCEAPLEWTGKGRKPVFCSDKCRTRYGRSGRR